MSAERGNPSQSVNELIAASQKEPSRRAMEAAVSMEVYTALSYATVAKARALDEHFPAYDELVDALKSTLRVANTYFSGVDTKWRDNAEAVLAKVGDC